MEVRRENTELLNLAKISPQFTGYLFTVFCHKPEGLVALVYHIDPMHFPQKNWGRLAMRTFSAEELGSVDPAGISLVTPLAGGVGRTNKPDQFKVNFLMAGTGAKNGLSMAQFSVFLDLKPQSENQFSVRFETHCIYKERELQAAQPQNQGVLSYVTNFMRRST